MRLPAGPVKRIYIDRTAAAAGEPAWAIRVDAELAAIPGFTVVRAREWRCDGPCRGRGGLGDAMLTPTGPAFWLETTAEVVAF